jgi:hypothetical protein
MHRGRPLAPVEPQAFSDHPLAQGLARDPAAVPLAELLAGQRRAEVGVALPDDRDRQLAHCLGQPVVAGPTASARHQAERTALAKAAQQAEHLPSL